MPQVVVFAWPGRVRVPETGEEKYLGLGGGGLSTWDWGVEYLGLGG